MFVREISSKCVLLTNVQDSMGLHCLIMCIQFFIFCLIFQPLSDSESKSLQKSLKGFVKGNQVLKIDTKVRCNSVLSCESCCVGQVLL